MDENRLDRVITMKQVDATKQTDTTGNAIYSKTAIAVDDVI